MASKDLSQLSIIELFQADAEEQLASMTASLLALEKNPAAGEHLEALMRAAHSMKGAARIADLESIVRIAHVLEDCFVATQRGQITLHRRLMNELLRGVDLLSRISKSGGFFGERVASKPGHSDEGEEVEGFLSVFAQAMAGAPDEASETLERPLGASSGPPVVSHRVLRVRAEHVNHMLGLAGESLVESRWLKRFGSSLLRLKHLHRKLAKDVEGLRASVFRASSPSWEEAAGAFRAVQAAVNECQTSLGHRLSELDSFDHRSGALSHRLYHEALACRMRPFADAIHGFPRMVRDLAQLLGKEVELDVAGEDTQVDRDILEKLEAPLAHLVRNALDHGVEPPDRREASGKSRAGRLRLEARHSAGWLLVTVSDDGKGIEPERVRAVAIQRKLVTSETAARLTEAELLEFLFLPGFSVKEHVTEISGRGVGLDVVQTMVKSLRGTIRVLSEANQGTRFQLQLPITLSVLRSLLVRIAGQPFALPLAQVFRTVKLRPHEIRSGAQGKSFNLDQQWVPLASAAALLELPAPVCGSADAEKEIAVVVLGELEGLVGLQVDRFLGEHELVVHPFDSRLGKIQHLSAASVMEEGSPVLIADVADLVRSIQRQTEAALPLPNIERTPSHAESERAVHRRKRILVVDDSMTVRELERKQLTAAGFEVDLAIDGMDGWNALRNGNYDVLIADVDMPRMGGVELVAQVRRDARLNALRALIVSYKDRDEDRQRGIDAGADAYLAKGSLHEHTLVQAVQRLIEEVKP